MTQRRKPIPKSQAEISQNNITPHDAKHGKAIVNKNRAYNRSVKGDTVKQFSVGLKDVDETIVYYYNNVIKPSVIQNGTKKNVPIIYGSPERWAAVQKDGFLRDKNGKVQYPIIMFKRASVTKNRSLGNKLDANNPVNFGIFKKNYSKKNVYDRFSILTNRKPVDEYYGVIIPDYVDIVYSCSIFTEYTEQMNKIVESINFASDSYWGDPERFNFRASIDSFQTTTEVTKGEDRVVKTTFDIKMSGYIIPDSINTSIANMNKFYSKSSVSFGIEAEGIIESLTTATGTVPPVVNFPTTTTAIPAGGLLGSEKDYLLLNTLLDTNIHTHTIDNPNNSITFTGVSIATPPANFDALTIEDFTVYINGLAIEPSAIDSIVQNGSDVLITFNTAQLEYSIVTGMEVLVRGKFNID